MGKKNIQNGDGNINFGNHNSFENSNITIENNFATEKFNIITRDSAKPLKIGSYKITANDFFKTGIIGCIADLIAIFVFFKEKINLNALMIIVLISLFFIFLFAIGVELKRKRFIHFPFGNFEADKEEKIFITKLNGICPFCGGKLRYTESSDYSQQYFICMRNTNHLFSFDYTELDNIPLN